MRGKRSRAPLVRSNRAHLHIWTRGDQQETAATFARIEDDHEIAAIHLSHNDGRADSHELIPPGVWFEPLVPRWAADHLVTYESLPTSHAEHERLDTRRNRWHSAVARRASRIELTSQTWSSRAIGRASWTALARARRDR